eukprot:SAG11_NODE_1611_length_4583_cov_3.380687_3_plen_115_part_00
MLQNAYGRGGLVLVAALGSCSNDPWDSGLDPHELAPRATCKITKCKCAQSCAHVGSRSNVVRLGQEQRTCKRPPPVKMKEAAARAVRRPYFLATKLEDVPPKQPASANACSIVR